MSATKTTETASVGNEIISVIYGNSTFNIWSVKGHIYVLEPSTEGVLSRRVLAGNVLERVKIGRSKIPAHRQGFRENGFWYAEGLKSEQGKVLCVLGTLTRNGSVHASGMYFVELDPFGPLVGIDLLLPPHADSSFSASDNKVRVFYGRGHIIDDPKNMLPEMDIRVNRSTLDYNLDPEELEELFDIEMVKKGRDRPKYEKLITDTGTIVKVKAGPERRLRLRKRD